MESIMKSDIFFFVTTISVSLVTILFMIVLLYAIRIFRKIDSLSQEVKEEGSALVEDLRNFRIKVKEQGVKISHIADLFNMFRPHVARVKKSPRKKPEIL